VGDVEASLVDAASPCVFVAASALGATGTELPDALERDRLLLDRLEAIRCAASIKMGLAASLEDARALPSVPKVAMVAAPADCQTLAGTLLAASATDILVRMISIGQPHRAAPLTGALCLAAACRVPGSVPNRMLLPAARAGDLRIGHASGITLVAAEAETGPGGVRIRHATVYRTARRLFQGEVLYQARPST
jgi:2-methylaconitate cis-trans-isomerase PrpF